MLTVRVKINIASQTTPQIIPVVQGDTGRSILFEIADFVIPAQATATYFIKKPSGHAVYNSATIDRNTVLANLTAQSIAEVGENPGQVRIIKNDEVVTSFDFILDVEPFRGIDAIESTTEMNIFDQAVQQALEEIDGSLDSIVADEFSTSDSYLDGEYVLKDGVLYRFTEDHAAGAWSTSDTEAITVGEALEELAGGGGGGAVQSVNGKTGTVVLDAGDLEYDDEETYGSATVGKEISNLKGGLSDIDERVTALEQSGGGLTSDIKQALLQLAAKVAYVDDDGQDYYDDLHDALYVLSSISAVYTQSGTVYDTDSLDSLKTDLVVTAHYDDQSTETVTSYTLSGTLSTGTSTITVSYGGKTTTFNVTVTHATTQYTITNTLTHVSNSNNATEINAQASYSATLSADSGYVISSVAITMGGTDITSTAYDSNTKAISIASVTGNIVITATASESAYQLYDTIMANSSYTYNTDNAIYLPDYVTAGDVASLDELQVEFEMQLQSTPSSTGCVLGASNTGGSSELGGLKFMISSGGLGLYSHNVNVGSVYGNFNDVLDLGRHIVKYVNTNVSPFTYYCDNSSKEVSWTTASAYTPKLGLSFCNQTNGTPAQVASKSIVKIGYIKLWDKNGNLLNHFAPAVRKSDNFVGMYDADKDVFVTANQNTRYTCGNWTVTS